MEGSGFSHQDQDQAPSLDLLSTPGPVRGRTGCRTPPQGTSRQRPLEPECPSLATGWTSSDWTMRSGGPAVGMGPNLLERKLKGCLPWHSSCGMAFMHRAANRDLSSYIFLHPKTRFGVDLSGSMTMVGTLFQLGWDDDGSGAMTFPSPPHEDYAQRKRMDLGALIDETLERHSGQTDESKRKRRSVSCYGPNSGRCARWVQPFLFGLVPRHSIGGFSGQCGSNLPVLGLQD